MSALVNEPSVFFFFLSLISPLPLKKALLNPPLLFQLTSSTNNPPPPYQTAVGVPFLVPRSHPFLSAVPQSRGASYSGASDSSPKFTGSQDGFWGATSSNPATHARERYQ